MDNTFFIDRWEDARYDTEQYTDEDEAQDAENKRATDAYVSAEGWDDENITNQE